MFYHQDASKRCNGAASLAAHIQAFREGVVEPSTGDDEKLDGDEDSNSESENDNEGGRGRGGGCVAIRSAHG